MECDDCRYVYSVVQSKLRKMQIIMFDCLDLSGECVLNMEDDLR